jgi:nucleoside-diphosphate-sugar epimerase
LAQRNFKVTLFDNSEWLISSAYAIGLESNEAVECVFGSVLNPSDLDVLKDDFDYIIHAAGVLGIKKVAERQILTMDVNISGTRHVLDVASRQKSLKRFIQFSTSEVYGQFASSPEENQPFLIPGHGRRWCYATSKVAGEYFVNAFAAERNISTVIVRPFNVYGSYRYGSNALTALAKNALAGEKLIISGNGQQTRSWCHISDYVQGVLACLQTEGISGEAFNIGNDTNNISMSDLAQLICKIVDSSSEIIIDGIDSEDVQFRKPNIDKARQLLGYDPKIDLSTGIEDLVKWLKSE